MPAGNGCVDICTGKVEGIPIAVVGRFIVTHFLRSVRVKEVFSGVKGPVIFL